MIGTDAHRRRLHGRHWRWTAWLCVWLALFGGGGDSGGGGCDAAVLIADYSMSRMVELIAKRPFCKLHTDRYVLICIAFHCQLIACLMSIIILIDKMRDL